MDKQELDQLQAALKTSEDSLKVQLKAQDAEIAAHGETTAKTAKSIEAAELRIDQVISDVKGLSDETVKHLTEELVSTKARLDEMEKAGQRPGWEGAGAEELKTPGEMFVESEQFKAARAAGVRETAAVEMKNLFSAIEQKSVFLSTAATRLVQPQRTDIVSPVLRRLRIRDLFPVRTTSSNAIEYLEETGFAASGAATGTKTHGAAAPTAEGAALPETQLEMELKTANVRDIGHWIPATRQVLADEGQLRSYIDDRLVYGVAYAEETQLLYGDGVSPNLEGILINSNKQDYAWSTGTIGDTKLDALRRAATLAHVLEYMPTGMVVNPTDWEDIQLSKGSDGHYIWLMVSQGTGETVFRLPVVVTNAIVATQALVGSFALGATIWDREQANIRISEHHEDFFTKRLVAILAEERIALANYRPDAFVDVDFDAAPS